MQLRRYNNRRWQNRFDCPPLTARKRPFSMQTNDITAVVQQVQDWPIPMRITLVRKILEGVETHPKETVASQIPRVPSAAEIAAIFRSDKAAPDDQAVREWIGDYRAEKYGS